MKYLKNVVNGFFAGIMIILFGVIVIASSLFPKIAKNMTQALHDSLGEKE